MGRRRTRSTADTMDYYVPYTQRFRDHSRHIVRQRPCYLHPLSESRLSALLAWLSKTTPCHQRDNVCATICGRVPRDERAEFPRASVIRPKVPLPFALFLGTQRFPDTFPADPYSMSIQMLFRRKTGYGKLQPRCLHRSALLAINFDTYCLYIH